MRLRRSDYLASLDSFARVLDSSRYADAVTDDSGRFTFEGIDTGFYMIEIQMDSILSTIGACTLIGYKDTSNLGNLSLDTMAQIRGQISDSGRIYIIRPFGLERLAAAQADGSFGMRLPNGKYSIHLLNKSEATTTIQKDFMIDYRSDPSPILVFPLPQWNYLQQIRLNTTFTGANTAEIIYDFPLLLRLGPDNFDFRQADMEGKDLRFVSPSTESGLLDYEIETWDSANQTASIWVYLDSVPGNSATQQITMAWGSHSATSRSHTFLADPLGYIAYFHLSGTIPDSTIRPFPIVNSSNSELPAMGSGNLESVEGIAGRAIRFGGDGSYLSVAHSPSLALDSVTGMLIACWFKLDKIPDDSIVVIFDKSEVNRAGWQIALEKHESDRVISFRVDDIEKVNEPFLPDLQWHLLSVVRMPGGKKIRFYIDGAPAGPDHTVSNTPENTAPLYIGGKPGYHSFPGVLDEVYIWSDLLLVAGDAEERSLMRLLFENQRPNQRFIEY